MNIKFYDGIDAYLPEKREDQSLEDWSNDIRDYIDTNKDNYDLTEPIRRPEVRGADTQETQEIIDTALSTFMERGLFVYHQSRIDDSILILSNKSDNETYSEWSKSLTDTIRDFDNSRIIPWNIKEEFYNGND